MKKTGKKFVPMKVWTDGISYDLAQKKAKEKLIILYRAFDWCSEHIDTDAIDRQAFIIDMVKEFRRCLQEQRGDILKQPLPVEKLMFLLDIQDSPLTLLNNEFHTYAQEVVVTENGDDWKCEVNKESFTRYTKDVEENDQVVRGNNLIKAIEMVGKYRKVYPLTIQQATSSFLLWDMRTQQYRVNI